MRMAGKHLRRLLRGHLSTSGYECSHCKIHNCDKSHECQLAKLFACFAVRNSEFGEQLKSISISAIILFDLVHPQL